MAKFKIGDLVKGKGQTPFDIVGDVWIIDKIEINRIGSPCWLRHSVTKELYEYMVPSDCLVLVKKTKLTNEQIMIRELEERVRKIERHLGINRD